MRSPVEIHDKPCRPGSGKLQDDHRPHGSIAAGYSVAVEVEGAICPNIHD